MVIPQDEVKVREYEKQVYAGKEPTFENIASFYPAMKYPNTMVGVDGYPGETYISWNGDIICPVDLHYPQKVGDGIFMKFAFDYPFVFIGDCGEVKRSRLNGYLPIVTTEWQKGNILFKNRVFASVLREDVMVTFIKITLKNGGKDKERVRFWVSIGRQQFLSNERELKTNDDPGLPSKLYHDYQRYLCEDATGPFAYSQPLDVDENGTLFEMRKEQKRVVCAFKPIGKWHTWYGPVVQATDTKSRNAMFKGCRSLDNVMEYDLEILPGDAEDIYIRIPFYPMLPEYLMDFLDVDEETHLNKVKSHWEQFLKQGTQFNMPERVISDAVKTLQITSQIMNDEIDGKKYPFYGGFLYDGITWDCEGRRFIKVLDLYGYHAEAQQLLENLLERAEKNEYKINGEFAEREGWLSLGEDWLYPNGSAGSWAICEHFRLTGDIAWLRRMMPKLISSANWIKKARATTKQLDEKGQKVLHYGLIPRGAWCDIKEWEYWFYTSAFYYSSLLRIAEVLRAVDEKEADEWVNEVREFKEDILHSIDACVDYTSDPPFIPLAPYVKEPYPGQSNLQENLYGRYYSLVGPQILIGCGILEATDKRTSWILRWLEEQNGLLLGLSRVKEGIDAKYSFEPAMCYLQRGEITKTVLTLYSYRAYNMSRDTCSTSEVYQDVKNGGTKPQWWSPCYPDRYANSIFLMLVRNIMVREEKNELCLLDGVPRNWLDDGKTIKVENAPTYFGKVTFTVTSNVSMGKIRVELHLPEQTNLNKFNKIFLRLRHPQKSNIRCVAVNNTTWHKFESKPGLIELDSELRTQIVVASY